MRASSPTTSLSLLGNDSPKSNNLRTAWPGRNMRATLSEIRRPSARRPNGCLKENENVLLSGERQQLPIKYMQRVAFLKEDFQGKAGRHAVPAIGETKGVNDREPPRPALGDHFSDAPRNLHTAKARGPSTLTKKTVGAFEAFQRVRQHRLPFTLAFGFQLG